MSGRTRDAVFDLRPFAVADSPGAFLGPILPDIAAASEYLSVPITAQHRAGGQIDRRQVHADRAHQQSRRGLVATTHQNDAVDWLAAQQLFGFHCQEVPIHHRARLHERFVNRHCGQFDRKSAGLPHASLYFISARPKVAVTGREIAPRVDYSNDWLVCEIFDCVAHLLSARAMAKGAQVFSRKPALTA